MLDEESGAVDTIATDQARDAEHEKRKQQGKPYKEFVKEWETEKPPANVPFYGSWKDRDTIYRGSIDDTCPADAIEPIMMPDPKDVRISELEDELQSLREQN